MTQYSDQDVTDLLDKMTEERATLFESARSLSEEDANRVPANATGEEQWTAKEQLAHLLESDRVHTSFAKAAIGQSGVDITAIRLTASEHVAIPIERAPDHNVGEIIAAMEKERARALQFVRSLRLEEFERIGKDNEFGDLTVMQWLRSLYRHDRQHRAQIEGRKSDYEPRYLSGKEPEQRLARRAKVQTRETQRR